MIVSVGPIDGQVSQTGTVEIYRIPGGHGSLPIRIDSQCKLDLSVSRRLTLTMTAGAHKFEAKLGKVNPVVKVEVQPGKTAYIVFKYQPPSFGSLMAMDQSNLTLTRTNAPPDGIFKDEEVDAKQVAAVAALPSLYEGAPQSVASQTAVLTDGGAKEDQKTPTSNALTNDSIIKMSSMGLQGPVIIAVIQTQASDFDVTPAALVSLTKAQVPASVIAAMIHKSASASKKPPFFGTQVTPTLIESEPYYVKGQTVQMIRAPAIHILAFVVALNEQYGFEKIAVVLRNTGTHSIDFNPQAQMAAYNYPDGRFNEPPMDSNSVTAIAAKIKHKQAWGILAAGMAGSIAADQYSQYSPSNTYEQARSDDATDAASEESQQQFNDATQNQLLESTLEPQQIAQGWVYFQIPKKGRKPTKEFLPAYFDVTIDGISYRLAID